MPENKQVTFRVTAIDRAGNESVLSAPLTVIYVPRDIIAPSVPSGLSSSNITTSGFKVNWTASTDSIGVTGYNIYRNGAYFATVGGTTTSYTFSGLLANTTYSITVLAYDAEKNRSALSTALSVKTLSVVSLPDTQAPTIPGGLSASNMTTSGFRVSWTASTDNVGVTGYNVYRNGAYVATVGGTTTNYTFSGLAANTTYNITVMAYDAAKNKSALSTALGVKTLSDVSGPDTQGPTVPGAVSSSNVTTSGFNVSWSASTDNVGVTGYNIYRNGAYVATVSASVRNYSFSGLLANTTYNITVLAYDAAKNRSALSTALSVKTLSVVSGPDTQSPNAPGSLVSSNVTKSGFKVNWSAASDNIGVAGYNVYRNGAYVATVGGATTTYTFSGLAANTTYNITVLAYDTARNKSALSTTLSVKTLSN
jgi:chitodextrinase